MVETDDFISPVNLGNPIESSILEIANKILLITESQSRIVFKPLPPDDPDRRCPDITAAKKILNWEPKVPLDVGLRRTIAYFSKKLEEK
jgi:UDP-glucuronate decarboxylase